MSGAGAALPDTPSMMRTCAPLVVLALVMVPACGGSGGSGTGGSSDGGDESVVADGSSGGDTGAPGDASMGGDSGIKKDGGIDSGPGGDSGPHDGGPVDAGITYTVGGNVSGLVGKGLVLENNGADDLPVSANGPFTFSSGIADGGAYAVTVKTQPSLPAQKCSVSAGSGTIAGQSVNAVQITCATPAPRYAVVGSYYDNSASTYAVNPSTGRLEKTDRAAAGNGPWAVAVTPNGQYAYVTNLQSDDISAYAVGVDGRLTPIACTSGCSAQYPANFAAGGSASVAMVVDPTGQYLYVANRGGNVSQFLIDSSGGLTPMATPSVMCPNEPYAIAVDPSGQYVYVANHTGSTVSQFTIGSSGALTPMATPTVAAGTNPEGVVVDPGGRYVYVSNYGSNDVSAYAIGASGALTQIVCASGCSTMVPANFAAGKGAAGVTVDPTGTHAYTANFSDGDVTTFSIGATGALTALPCTVGCSSFGGVQAGPFPVRVVIDPGGKYAYVVNSGNGVSQYTIDGTGHFVPDAPATVPAFDQPLDIGLTQGAALVRTPRSLYVGNFTSNDVSAYTIGSGGALTQVACTAGCSSAVPADFAAGTGAHAVAVTPGGRYAYVANFWDGTVSQFSVAADGSLTARSTPTVLAGNYPMTISIDPGGWYAYVVNESSSDISAYAIGVDGTLTQVKCTTGCSTAVPANFAAGTNPYALTVDPSGKYAYVANYGENDVSAFTVLSNGQLQPINCGGGAGCSTSTPSNFASGVTPIAVTVDPSGTHAYVADYNGYVSQYQVHADGTLAPLTPSSAQGGTNTVSITVEPLGRYAYAANWGSADVAAYTVATDGTLSPIGCNTGCSGGGYFAAGTNADSVIVDPTGSYAYVPDFGASNLSMYSLGAGGALTPMGTIAAGTAPQRGASVATWQ